MTEYPALLKFLLKYRIGLASVANATAFGLLRGHLNMWLAAFLASNCFAVFWALPVYWEGRFLKAQRSETEPRAN